MVFGGRAAFYMILSCFFGTSYIPVLAQVKTSFIREQLILCALVVSNTCSTRALHQIRTPFYDKEMIRVPIQPVEHKW